MVAAFLAAYYLPFSAMPHGHTLTQSLRESFLLLQDYARKHMLLCLIPAFFIAGAIAMFVSKGAVLKYFGSQAHKVVSYAVASVSGGILAVCSCTILPLFAGIYSRGAGIGPATTFLYAGPAVNVLALILTAQILGYDLGIARIVAAVVFSVIIGLIMSLIYRKEEMDRLAGVDADLGDEESPKPLVVNIFYFGSMVGLLVFANWSCPENVASGFFHAVFTLKWILAGIFACVLILVIWLFFSGEELKDWGISTWGYVKDIVPLLFAGVLVAGFLLGSGPDGRGLIPRAWVEAAVGGNSLRANFFASFAGAFMYFATCTEVPILQGLIGSGMGKGPALALLLSGPALSLPNMLVIRSVLGTQKTIVYVSLVIILSTLAGMLFGLFAAAFPADLLGAP